MSDALYFLQNAAAKTNVYNILGNAVMRRVVTGALGLPAQMVVQSVETQARAVTSRLKLADLQDPRKVQKLAERYVIAAGRGPAAAARAARCSPCWPDHRGRCIAGRTGLPLAAGHAPPPGRIRFWKGAISMAIATKPGPASGEPHISPPAPAPSVPAGRWMRSRAPSSAAAIAPPAPRPGSPR